MQHRQCIECSITKQIDCTDEQYARWRAGELIQNAMPNVPADQRELLISGICGECFDRMFKPHE